jgi:signal transduction histidine kinase
MILCIDMDKQKTSKENQFAYNKLLFRWIILLPISIDILIMFVDPPFVAQGLRSLYVSGRAIELSIFLILFCLSFFNQKSWHLNWFYGLLMAHSIFGQFFLPCYYLGFMEGVFCFALFLPLTSRGFYGITFVSAALMIYAITYSGVSYTTDPIINNKFIFDANAGTILSGIVACLGFHFVTYVRKEKDILSAKFLDVGKHTSSLIHDFKGLLSTPMMYVQMLERDKQKYDAQTNEIISNLYEDFLFLDKYIKETNNLNNLKTYNDTFELNDVIQSLQVIMKGSLRGIVVNVENNPTLNFSKNLLLKVLYNLLMNSIEAQKNNVFLKIYIYADRNLSSIFIADNGKGFDPQTLKKLNSGAVVESTKEKGSAIGTLIVKDLIRSIGGSVVFSNSAATGGSLVQIKIPASSFIT